MTFNISHTRSPPPPPPRSALTHAVDMEAQPLWNGELYLPLPADPAAAAATEAAAVKALLAAFEGVAAARQQGGGAPEGSCDAACAASTCGGSCNATAGAAGACGASCNTTAAASGGGRVHRDLWMHVRYVAGDTNSYLNPCYGAHHCAAIELALVAHTMAAPLPPWAEWAPYFSAMQDVLLPLGGRPHAAKFHSITREQLPEPAFGLPVARFQEECRKFDPQRLMRDAVLDDLLGMA